MGTFFTLYFVRKSDNLVVLKKRYLGNEPILKIEVHYLLKEFLLTSLNLNDKDVVEVKYFMGDEDRELNEIIDRKPIAYGVFNLQEARSNHEYKNSIIGFIDRNGAILGNLFFWAPIVIIMILFLLGVKSQVVAIILLSMAILLPIIIILIVDRSYNFLGKWISSRNKYPD